MMDTRHKRQLSIDLATKLNRMYFISGIFYQISKHGILSFIVATFLRDKSTASLQLAEQPHSRLELHLLEPAAGVGIAGRRRGMRMQG